jgi:hypothetical protein
MGVSNYNCLSNPDLGYTKYGSTTRADFWNEITPTVRYSRPTSMTVRKSPKGISRIKGRDQGVIKCSSVIIRTTSYISISFVCISSVCTSFASFTLFINQSQGVTVVKLV